MMKMSIAEEDDEIEDTLNAIYEMDRNDLRRCILKLAERDRELQSVSCLSELSKKVSKYVFIQRLNNQLIKEDNVWGTAASTPEFMLRELNNHLQKEVAKYKLDFQCKFTSTYDRGLYRYSFEAMDVTLMSDKKEELANVLLI